MDNSSGVYYATVRKSAKLPQVEKILCLENFDYDGYLVIIIKNHICIIGCDAGQGGEERGEQSESTITSGYKFAMANKIFVVIKNHFVF